MSMHIRTYTYVHTYIYAYIMYVHTHVRSCPLIHYLVSVELRTCTLPWICAGLVQQLEALKVDEVIDQVGPAILQWIPSLSPYIDYCANLVTAKHVMEVSKHNPAVVDFLQRCLDSEFSRKIELWTFLG